MWRALRLTIDLLLGEHPPSGFGQVAPHGDNGLLMIFGAFDSLIQPDYMSSGEPALVDHDQIADLHKSPFQISIYVPANLAHPCVAPTGMYSRNQAGVAGQVRGRRESIHFPDLQHQNHAENLSHAGQSLQQIRFHAHIHNRFEPMLGRFNLGF